MRTLVLNAGYEPLAVVTFRRALVLVLAGKASVLVEDDEPIRGPHEIFARPAVILLNRYVRIPYVDDAVVTRRGVMRRDSYRCAYCGKSATTVDHVLPRSRGGADTWENLVACCLACNNRKGDHTLAQLGWKLSTVPHRPQGTRWRIRELDKPSPHWDPFLASNNAA